MSLPTQPRLRRIDSFPVSQSGGEVVFALRDPEGFASTIVLPYAAAVLASFMDGTRTLPELQEAIAARLGQHVDSSQIAGLIRQLDERWFLDTDRFRARWKAEIEKYLNSPVRPAAHAGAAYEADPQALKYQLADLFTSQKGPGAPSAETTVPGDGTTLCGVLSPHSDLQRGGTASAWAYKRLVDESPAELFVIFGTAHNPMSSLFSVTRKHFDTPLGIVETDKAFVAKLSAKLAATPGGTDLNIAADELAHRQELSIEFQVLFLQYLLGERRPFKIVPVLTGSFHEFVGQTLSPANSPQVQAFVAAMRNTAAEYPGRICYISGGDLAHIGQRFGDRTFLDASRLKEQAEDDHKLLEAACRPDADGFFRHIAEQQDRNRICGLSPTYTMLEVMRPTRGELLRYDQAVELDGTSCVSFASAAYYRT